MTVVMHDNVDDLSALLELSREHGVRHQVTVISTVGAGRHIRAQHRPAIGVGARLVELKREFPHLASFTGYLEGIDEFLGGTKRSRCWAGERFLNIDHLGDVSPCIEKLHLRAGNLLREPWSIVAARLAALEEPMQCSECWSSCRGFVEEMSGFPQLRAWREFLGDFARST